MRRLDIGEAALPYRLMSLPFDGEQISPALLTSFEMLCSKLMKDYRKNAVHTKRGNTKCYNISANRSKPIIDEIDELLAKHYGFTEEELDFIINYDIKYRMGDELNAGA